MTLPLAASVLLTPRQAEVFAGLARDLAYKEIAAALGISVETVKSHAKHARERLHVASNEAAIYKLRNEIQTVPNKE